MGWLLWPRKSFSPGLAFVLAGFSLLGLPASAMQIVPDDIAFKPVTDTSAIEVPATAPKAQPDSKLSPKTESLTGSENNSAATGLVESVDQPESQTPSVDQKCKAHDQWRKNLTITAMPRLIPTQSNAGNFYQAETQIPKMLAKELNLTIGLESRLIPQTISQNIDEEKKRRQTQMIAAQQGTQFVLHGEILDISMRDDSTVYSPGLLQAIRNQLTDLTLMHFSDNRQRLFHLHLELRDGFTGEVLLDDVFQTTGIWKNPKAVGFTSDEVWQSQYGRRIKQLINQAGHQIARNLQCQPYMTKIESIPGQTELVLQGGANNGLHPGDQLKLYQLVVVPSPNQYDSFQTRLIKRNLHLQLTEVYPSHSVGLLKGDDFLNGQFLAVGGD
jgi:Flagellar assembly protein T, middle domain